MDKKIKIEIAFGIIFLVAILVGLAILGWNDGQSGRNPSVTSDRGIDNQEQAFFGGKAQNENYKKVELGDDSIKISFEMPANWIEENRNFGREKVSNEDKEDFFKEYYLMGEKDVDLMAYENKRSNYGLYQFPNASVSSKIISYMDDSGGQINFYLENKSLETTISSIKKKLCDRTCDKYENKNGSMVMLDETGNSMCLSLNEEKISGYQSSVILFNTDLLDNKPWVTKNCSGGKIYFLKIDNAKTLIIYKEALGDEIFESSFDHIINTIKINA